ncbi:MAG: hypothetical protein ACXABY_09750 [Candidatus Thorarchaeota archaeon]|jgi:hypothetical protein
MRVRDTKEYRDKKKLLLDRRQERRERKYRKSLVEDVEVVEVELLNEGEKNGQEEKG